MSTNRTKIGLPAANRVPSYDKETLREAVRNNINLSGLHFKDIDLRDITLDGINLTHVTFENCDLTGANISEAVLKECKFLNTRLFDCCFCYTEFNNCSFIDVHFGATDFSGSQMHYCIFNGVSTFNIDFSQMENFTESIYRHDNSLVPMHKIPLIVKGLVCDFIFLDHHVLIGNDVFEIDPGSAALFSSQIQQRIIMRSTLYN